MSPSRKRAVTEDLQEEFSVSERRACEVLDQPRSKQRYESKPRDDEPALVKQMLEMAQATSSMGLSAGGLGAASGGVAASATRVYRLWRREGLKVPQKSGKSDDSGRVRTAAFADVPSPRTTFGPGTSCLITRRAGASSSGCRSSTSIRGSAWP